MTPAPSEPAPRAPSSPMLLWVKVLSLAVLALIVWGVFQSHEGASDRRLPTFELAWLEGGVFTNEDLKGRVTVVNFFATWCGPCRMEMPALNRFASSMDPAKVRVVGVSAGDEDRVRVREFVFVQRLTFPVAVGGERLLGEVALPKLPTTVIVDAAGHIVEVYSGVITESRLRRRIDELIH